MEQTSPATLPNSHGYTRLADFMAWDPPTAAFHRFRAANALNLLGLQAEICRLQEDLALDTETSEKDDSMWRQVQVNWSTLQDSRYSNRSRYETLTELRSKLDMYNHALIQQITLNNQESPSRANLDQLKNWLKDIYHGANELRGPGSNIWQASKQEDLISVWPRQASKDWLTRRLFNFFTWVPAIVPYLHVQKRSFPGRLPDWLGPGATPQDFEIVSTTSAIARMGNSLATALCCAVITVPIIVMNYTPTDYRLLVIAVSTLFFSLTLTVTSDVARKDVFTATAAFVAVQVVFIGGNPSTPSCQSRN